MFTLTPRRTALALMTLALAGFSAPTVFAFSDDGVSVTRAFSRTYAVTNSAIVVTCTVTNGSTNTLRGFFYGEQVPTSLTLASPSVTLNGGSITNYVLESGQDGDVYVGCTPWRWVLEMPTNYTPANPFPSEGVLRISYSLTSSTLGTASLQQFGWADGKSLNTNAGFGYSEQLSQQSLSFVVTTNQPILFGYFSTNGYVVSLQGVSGATYALDASSDLATWLPLVTNVSSFSYTNAQATQGRGFYRGRIPVGP